MPTRKRDDLPKTGKIIAFDVGAKTLGVALSDRTRMIASPSKTIQRTKWEKDKEIIQTIITTQNIAAAVVGLPLSMTGESTAQTDVCISFAHLLEESCGIPVLLWDERLSTAAATNALFEQRIGRQKRASKKDIKQQVDSVAAALFLQSVLDGLHSI